MNRLQVARITKGIIDFMFYAGILVCLTLPISLRYLGTYFPHYKIFYIPMLILFLISGMLSILIIQELRSIFRTVLNEDCFVKENVKSLRRMGNYSFCIAAVSGLWLHLPLW